VRKAQEGELFRFLALFAGVIAGKPAKLNALGLILCNFQIKFCQSAFHLVHE